MSSFEFAAKVSELKPGRSKVICAVGRDVALFNVEGQFFALDNVCPHRGGSLGEGMLKGNEISCPWHGWTFNVKDGSSHVNPKVFATALRVKIEGEDILVGAS